MQRHVSVEPPQRETKCRAALQSLTARVRHFRRSSSLISQNNTPQPDQNLPGIAKISTVTAITIAVADMIGTGVFTSLGFQVAPMPSSFAVLMLWVVGGLTALGGALSYAELATMFPRSGGEYNFLSRIFHPAVGFLAGWVSATVGFTAPIALAAMAFGTYFAGVFPGAPALLLGLALVWGVTIVHLFGVRQGSRFQNISTFVKLALIVVLIVCGLALGDAQPISFIPTAKDAAYISGAPFAIGLVFVLYSYSGWNAATYIASEVHEPTRSLPRAIFVSLAIVLVLYIALNAVFLYTTPMAELAGKLEVAQIAGQHIFGETGGRVVAALICFGLISSVSAMVWIGPRVSMTMGEDLPALRMFARKSARGVPVTAMVFQVAVVTLLLLTQSFNEVVDFIQFSLTFCAFLTVLGVIVMRITAPDMPRPYRTWGYPLTPVIFLAVSAYTMYYLLTVKPVQSLAGLATMLAGLIFYYLSQKKWRVSALLGSR
jgi:basic amino acid/polyamine antiporter, APA family